MVVVENKINLSHVHLIQCDFYNYSHSFQVSFKFDMHNAYNCVRTSKRCIQKESHNDANGCPSELNRDHPLSADCANESLKHVHERHDRFPSPLVVSARGL